MERKNSLALVVLVSVIILFVVVQSRGLLHFDNSDENIYFYMSYLVSEGKLPYRDFFYAHPPLELLFGASVFRLFGFNLFILKLIPLTAIVVSGILVYLIAKGFFGEAAGLLSAAFFLFSYRVMAEATYFMGINIALMFLLFGFYYLGKRPYLAGLMFAFACLTRLLVIVPVIIILAFYLLKKPMGFFKLVSVFAVVFGIANLILALFFPMFFVSVYKFHLMKPPVEGRTVSLFFDFVPQNILLVMAALCAFLLWNKRLLLFAVISVSYLVFLLQLGRVFNFYFLVAIPFLAVIAGVSVDYLLKKVSYQKVAVAAVIVVFLINAAFIANRLWFFDFQDFRTGKEIAGYIRANTGPDGLIYGDASSVPLISLFSSRRIADDLVDTNDMVYLSGVRGLDSELKRVKDMKPVYVVIRPLYGIGGIEKTQQFLDGNCGLERRFKDPYWADFLVYRC
ncbi:glycosyltransferase family 39 protein [Candidatus Woesearchaeota archaeon]|nr:glycosyltransferase family 39 protein [Candidatus Woesearchaeota archaeon]